MSQNLLIAFVTKLTVTVETKNSWGKNELILEIQRAETAVLREALEQLQNPPQVPLTNK